MLEFTFHQSLGGPLEREAAFLAGIIAGTIESVEAETGTIGDVVLPTSS